MKRDSEAEEMRIVRNSRITCEKCRWNFFWRALLVDVGDDREVDLLTAGGVGVAPPVVIDGVLLLRGLESWLEWEKFKLDR